MFRKGGSVEEGVVSLASGGSAVPRKQYANGKGKRFEELLQNDPYLQEIYDIAQAGYGRDVQQEKSDVLANLLIRGGLNLVGGVGAGDGTLAGIYKLYGQGTQALNR